MKNIKHKKIIGIIGGVGPLAGVDLHKRIIENTIATKDQDHFSVIHGSFSSIITDRTNYLMGNESVPSYKGIIETAHALIKGGANILCIPCNTAHHDNILTPFIDWLKKNHPTVEYIHIIDSCVKEILNRKVKKISILATLGTNYFKIYDKFISNHPSIEQIPLSQKQNQKVHELIFNKNYGLKAVGKNEKNLKEIKKIINDIKNNHDIEAIILGCTELPILFDNEYVYNKVILINPTEILARILIKKIDEKKLKPQTI